MATYSVEAAQGSLTDLLTDAHQGKTIIIRATNGRAVRLVPTPVAGKRPRKAGSARGLVWMSDDFDAPLEDFADYME